MRIDCAVNGCFLHSVNVKKKNKIKKDCDPQNSLQSFLEIKHKKTKKHHYQASLSGNNQEKDLGSHCVFSSSFSFIQLVHALLDFCDLLEF